MGLVIRVALRRVLLRVPYRSEIRFGISFLVNAGVLFSIYSFPYAEETLGYRWSADYLRVYAQMAGWVLSLFDPHVRVSEQIILGRYGLRIIRGCDAVDVQILLVAAILATHVYSLRWRIGGALLGFVLVTMANVVRICSLYYVGAFLPSHFDFFHHELWPFALVAVAAGAFVLWFKVAHAKTGIADAVSRV